MSTTSRSSSIGTPIRVPEAELVGVPRSGSGLVPRTHPPNRPDTTTTTTIPIVVDPNVAQAEPVNIAFTVSNVQFRGLLMIAIVVGIIVVIVIVGLVVVLVREAGTVEC